MTFRMFTFLLIFAGGFASVSFSQSWQFLNGPLRPHEVTDVAIGKDAGGNQKIYAAGLLDDLRLSTNAGSSWSAIGTSYFTQPVAVASQKDNPNIVVVSRVPSGAPLGAGIFLTSDGGTTWQDKTPDGTQYAFRPQRIVISSGNPILAFLGTEKEASGIVPQQTSLWRSTTGGGSWFPIDYFKVDARTYVNDILAHPLPAYANYIWVGGSTKDLIDPPAMGQEGSELGYKTKGLWRSADGGASWAYFGDALDGSDRNITALAISIAGTNQLLLAATMTGTQVNIYQSNDLGVSWVLSANRPSGATQIRSMKVSHANANLILAGTETGVFMSTDRGGTWGAQNGTLPPGAYNIYDVEFDLNDASGNTVYIATGTSVYKGTRSNDLWSWVAATTGTNNLNTSSLSIAGGTIYAASSSWNAITRYSGSSWSIVKSVKGFLANSTGIGSDGSTAFVGGGLNTRGMIYRSTDGGTAWSESKLMTTPNTMFSTLAPDPKANSQYVFTGVGGSGVITENYFRSTNLGSTWPTSPLISGVNGVVVNTLAVNHTSGSSNSIILYAGLGSSKGVYKSTDGGASFSFAARNGYDIAAIAMNPVASQSVIYLSSLTNVWKSINGLASEPSPITTPFTGAKRIMMHPSYPSLAGYIWVITGNGQKIYKYVNGMTWSEINTASLPKPLNDLRSDPGNTAFIYVATAGGVYKIDPSPETPVGFAVSGTNCTPSPCSGGGGGGTGLQALIPQECYPSLAWQSNWEADLSATGRYEVERRIGATGTWTVITTTNSTVYTDASVTLSPTGTTDVYYRLRAKDGGNNYSGYVTQVCVKASSAPAPTAVRSNDAEENIQPAALEEQRASEFKHRQNTPNPFNPMTKIEYDLAEDVHVIVKVYDVIGHEVLTAVDEFQKAGSRSVTFDAGALPSGIYFYRLTAGKFSDIRKMLLLR